MLDKIRSLIIIFSCFTTLTIFSLPYIAALMIFGSKKTVRLRQWYAKILIWSTFSRLKVSGEAPDKDCACVYVANHQSMFDSLMIAAAIPGDFSVIAKKGLKRIPVFGAIVRRMGYIFIDRNNLAEAGASIIQAQEKIKSGVSLMIFPEGTRTETGYVGKFKPGAFRLAKATGAMVVPIGISGSYEANRKGWNFRPGRLRINFGKPINPDEYDEAELSSKARIEIIKLYRTH